MVSTGGSVGAAATPTVWLSYEEERFAASHGPRGSYHHNFYLVDNHGKKLLAATGVDQGDAHYQYTSAPEIEARGTQHFECRNREHLKDWLQQLVAASQRAANFHVEQAHDEEHLAEIRGMPCPKHHPAFTGWRQEKFTNGDAPKVIKWWLLDVHGHEHMAVVGEEKENKDGHYAYITQEPFASTHPLNVGSQSKVLAWIEHMLHVHSPDSGAEGVTPGNSVGTAPPPELVSNMGTRGWQRPSAFVRPGSAGILGGAFGTSGSPGGVTPLGASLGKRVAAKRQKMSDTGRAGTPHATLEETRLTLDFLSKWALCEAVQRKTAVEAATAWMQEAVEKDTAAALEHYVQRAKVLLAEGSAAKRAAAAAPGNDVVLEGIEVLQELGTTYLPASALQGSGLVSLMQQLSRHKNAAVANMAAAVLARWTALTAHHLRVLTNPKFLEDPCDQLLQMLANDTLATAPVDGTTALVSGKPPPSPSPGTQHPTRLGMLQGFDAQLGEDPDRVSMEGIAPVMRSPRSARSPMRNPKLPWPTS